MTERAEELSVSGAKADAFTFPLAGDDFRQRLQEG